MISMPYLLSQRIGAKKDWLFEYFFDIQVGENCSTDLVLISNAGNKTDYTEDICVDLRWLNQLFV